MSSGMASTKGKRKKLAPSSERAKAGRYSQTGASRKPANKGASLWFGLLKGSIKYVVVFISIGCVFAVIVWFNPKEKLEQFTHKPINEVQIEGSFQLFDKQEAERIIEDQVTGSFIDLDIEKLKNTLEQNPWVDSVSIAREWPDKLIVKIFEQKAIARWGAESYLNMRGDIVNVENVNKIDDLPFLNSNDRYAKEVMQQYLRIGKLLSEYDVLLKSVDLDDTHSWTLIVNKEIIIKLGRDRIWEKLQSLMEAKISVLNNDFSNIQQIDMRYNSGFAIAWKSTKDNKYVAEG